MERVTSRDGTSIAYDRVGSGPALILVDGAMCRRAFGPAEPLAKRMAADYSVYYYDRRGRGDSGDTTPYDVDREVDDLAAIIDAAGGSAYVYGISSGVALVLEGAARGLPIRKMVLYELPMIVDGTRELAPPDWMEKLRAAVVAGKRGTAVRMFLRRVGMPLPVLLLMSALPVFRKMKAIAHTLVYDMTMISPLQTGRALPAGKWKAATVPALAVDGGKSPTYMRNGMRALAAALPNAEYRTIPGQTHMLKPDAIASVMREFFR